MPNRLAEYTKGIVSDLNITVKSIYLLWIYCILTNKTRL